MRRFFFGLAVCALAAPMPLLAETTDRQIAQQIVKELKCQKESGELKGFNLDLQVEDGAVYLKGFVSEREQRRKAVEVARRVEGVKQVFNEIEIKTADDVAAEPLHEIVPSTKPKASLASTRLESPPAPPQVNLDMVEADEVDAAAVDPAASDREVGGLLTAVEMESPVNIFRSPRPIAVTNEHTIGSREVAHTPTAREITEAIVDQYRTAMDRGELKGFGIDVQVDRGVVSLKGTVADPAQLEYAVEVARNARGVTKVINALEITDLTWQQDATLVSHDGSDEGVQHAFRQPSRPQGNDGEAERIAKEVVAGLQQQKQEGLLSNFGIDVQVDQRVVWMSGYVKNSEQHARALNVARYVRGVEKVVNDLRVQDQSTPLRPVAATLPQGMPLQPAPGQPTANYQLVPIQYMQAQAMQAQAMQAQAMQASNQTPMAFAPARPVNHTMMQPGEPVPMTGNSGVGIAPARFDHPQMPGYAWPSYAAYPNYGAVTYPKQYSPSAWPYIGPFYPYPQVPLGWRKVTLEWDDGWWNLKFKNSHMH